MQTHEKLLALMLLASAAPTLATELALIDAAREQDSAALHNLLAEGADPNASQPDGSTALHWAVHRADNDSVTALLTAGADVNTINRMGASALFIAARSGDANLIARLLEAGANPTLKLKLGETALMSAARTGAAEGIRLIVDAGADVNAKEQSRHQTALMWAAAQGHVAAASELLNAGADIETRSKVRPMLMFIDGANGGAFDQGVMENLGGYSPLLFAARNGNLEMARLLLNAGADINGEAGNGATPLVIATHSGHTSLAVMLLEEGADPDAIGAGYNPLHAAILRGDEKTINALLQHGANPNIRVQKATPVQRASEDWVLRTAHISATPYWLAANFREPGIMRTLVEWGANPTLTNEEQFERLRDRQSRLNPPALHERKVVGGFTNAIQVAVRGDSTRSRFYVQANPDPVDEEQLALEAVKVAVEHGVDLNFTDFNGSTALHDAAFRNLATIVSELAKLGADVNTLNNRRQTPLDLAIAAERRLGLGILARETPNFVGPTAKQVLEELGALRANQL
jgi:ankyrin repeat protein